MNFLILGLIVGLIFGIIVGCKIPTSKQQSILHLINFENKKRNP